MTVARVQVRMRPQSILATGNVVPWRQSAVASAAMGKVVDIPVDVGAVVREGQVLARLDDREARQRLAQAEAALAQAEAAEAQLRARLGLSGEVFDPRQTPEAEAAQAALTAAEAEARLAGATLERYERLARHDNITRAVLDEARTRLEAAQAQVQAARRRYAAILTGCGPSMPGYGQHRRALPKRGRPWHWRRKPWKTPPYGHLLPGMWPNGLPAWANMLRQRSP